jgi:type I restriction enzyme R subunit
VLKIQAPTVESVNSLRDEIEELNFVTHFRELLRLRNILVSFTDFKFEDLGIDEQEFENYKSKYLDLYEKVRNDRQKEKVSILEDIDFELELVRRDEVDVSYIIKLLARMVNASDEQKEQLSKNISDTLSSDPGLRSKRELIEKFINQNIPDIDNPDQVEAAFDTFWTQEKVEAFKRVCEEEGLDSDKLQQLIDVYLYSGRKPKSDDVAKTLKAQPKILERPGVVGRISTKLTDFINTFIEGI